jgi:hypothetical protein
MSTHFILLDFITRTILLEIYILLSFSLYNFFYSLFTTSLLGLYNLLNISFSSTLSLRSSLNVSDKILHPHKNKQNYSSIYLGL